MTEFQKKLDARIRNVPDFPKAGILFKDITPILQDAALFHEAVDKMAQELQSERITSVAGIESRGFIFASAIAYKMQVPLNLLRKPGKLPWKTKRQTYSLEYGADAIELHEDAVREGDRVALIDDLLATGGTATAAAELLRASGAEVCKILFVIELLFLKGREKLEHEGFQNTLSLISY